MSYDLTGTECPKCGADLTQPDSVRMRPYDSGHFEDCDGELVFVFDAPMSVAYMKERDWEPDAACGTCGAEFSGTYVIE